MITPTSTLIILGKKNASSNWILNHKRLLVDGFEVRLNVLNFIAISQYQIHLSESNQMDSNMVHGF